QQAWLEHDVPQCGYCQCGMIMAVGALLSEKPKPTDADIHANITNICPRGTFQQVRAAVHPAPGPGRGAGMNLVPRINHRRFGGSAAAFGGGLAIGMDIPFGPTVVRAADGSPEVTAWVVIKPDDGVVIRIARSEMGQGSMTGLAQLVAEELECDWSKVSTEFPTPGQNLARNLVWGRQFTAGSRAIRESHEYVRKA